LNQYQNLNKQDAKGSAIVSFALVAPLVFLVSAAGIQLIFLLMTYANISIASEFGAREISRGIPAQYIEPKILTQLNDFSYFDSSPTILFKKTLISGISLNSVEISVPIDWLLGIKFVLKSTSHAD
jgi:hypothetical protein